MKNTYFHRTLLMKTFKRQSETEINMATGNLTILTYYVNNKANNDPVSINTKSIFASSEYVLSKFYN